MTEQPKDWRVENGTFIGFVLVDLEPKTNAMGVKQKAEEGWLPYAHDLRGVNAIKQESPEHPERCCLYLNDVFLCKVNVAMSELLPQWLMVRHVFDEPESSRQMRSSCSNPSGTYRWVP